MQLWRRVPSRTKRHPKPPTSSGLLAESYPMVKCLTPLTNRCPQVRDWVSSFTGPSAGMRIWLQNKLVGREHVLVGKKAKELALSSDVLPPRVASHVACTLAYEGPVIHLRSAAYHGAMHDTSSAASVHEPLGTLARSLQHRSWTCPTSNAGIPSPSLLANGLRRPEV